MSPMDTPTRRQSLNLNLAKWFERNWIPGLIILLLLVQAGFILAWVWVELVWPAEDSQWKVSEPLPVAGTQVLQAHYPARLGYDAPPASITLTRWIATPSELTEPITITVNVSPGILLLSESGQPAIATTNLVFTSTTTNTQSIRFSVRNAQTSTGWGFASQTINIITSSESLPLSIESEEGYRGKFRSFVNVAVNERSPLLILIPGALSAIAWLVNLVQENARERKKVEESKQAEQGKRREEAKTLLESVKESLASTNIPAAKEALSKLQQEGFKENVPEDELKRAQVLTQLAEGSADSVETIVAVLKGKLEADAAGALIAGSYYLPDSQRRALIDNMRNLPRTDLPATLQLKLAQAIHSIQVIEERSRQWPAPRPTYTRATLSENEISEILKRLDGENPFHHDRAEDDKFALFSDSPRAFWEDHPAYSESATRPIPEIIYGPEGCGKTALALAIRELRKLQKDADKLAVYYSGQPTIADIQRTIVGEMLEFISVNPFVLARTGQHEQALLAQQFATGVGKKFALARLETAKRDETRLAWARHASQREIWAREDEAQFELLAQAIYKTEVVPWVDEGLWLQNIEQCARALSFSHVFVVLDADDDCEAWARTLLPKLRSWSAHSVIVKLFLPQDVGEKLAALANVIATPLTWSEAEITDMAEWRFNRFMLLIHRDIVLAELFAEEAVYKQFIQSAQNSPRWLNQMWNRMLAAHTPDRRAFEEEDLKRAL